MWTNSGNQRTYNSTGPALGRLDNLLIIDSDLQLTFQKILKVHFSAFYNRLQTSLQFTKMVAHKINFLMFWKPAHYKWKH